MKQILNFINGEFVATGKQFEKRTPLDNSLIGMVHEAGKAEVDAAVQAAQDALEGPWGKMTVQERTDILNKVADEITRRFDEFLEAECLDTGKPKSLASHIDIPRGAANFKIFADVIKNAPTEFFEMATPDGRGAINYAVRRPVGVVGVICPWNLPLLLMTWKVGPALACGNTVVMKASELVMVDFWAVWCGPCQMVAPIVDELAKDYAGKLKVLKLNTDENPEVAGRYQVMSIPTILFFKNGQQVEKLVGARPKRQFKEVIDALLLQHAGAA